MSLSYRLMEEPDRRFVLATWCTSYRSSRHAGLIHMDDWHTLMWRQFSRILERPGVDVWVAYAPEETDRTVDLHGWIAVERDYEIPLKLYEFVDGERRRVERMVPAEVPLVHYVFIKQAYRGEGIARGLFRAAGVDPMEPFKFSCCTAEATAFRSKNPRAEFNPLIARHSKKKPQVKETG